MKKRYILYTQQYSCYEHHSYNPDGIHHQTQNILFHNRTNFLTLNNLVFFSWGPQTILIFGERRKRNNYTSYRVTQSLISDSDDKSTASKRHYTSEALKKCKKSSFFFKRSASIDFCVLFYLYSTTLIYRHPPELFSCGIPFKM